MPMQNKTEWATIGKIVALFGVRGELKVLPLTDIPDRFTSLKAVHVSTDGHTFKRCIITSVRPYKGDMLLVKLEGITSANDAEALRDQSLWIPESELAQLPPDSYYQHDILGLKVYTLSNQEVGQIVDLFPTGGNDVYVVRTPERKEVMIPAIKTVVHQIDVLRGVMYIDPLPGLLDDQAVLDNSNEEDKEGQDEFGEE
ncbi:ribosome maturation factor RimM [Ktedonobacter racemifer]|uniref:Ribosome maturation factor RimM n=1 Tax=Ktedonobacter racemifer DSM 44963 TaxID=485913 RepID=D6U6Z3_KTERA|nr:ribosome maturation factor RimM [Ktedonobacter racemifer]EFH80754.1 16S rRNA processing protein RimM [Ktedonobacter racemifer DSM 44963]